MLIEAWTILLCLVSASGFSPPRLLGYQSSSQCPRHDSMGPAKMATATTTEAAEKTASKESLFVEWIEADSLEEVPHPGRKLKVEGSIPSYVNGDYIKNGPGALGTRDKSQRYTHLFDGLAKLQKFDIDGENNQVIFTTRFLDSKLKRSMLDTDPPFMPGHITVGPTKPQIGLISRLTGGIAMNTCVNVEDLSSTGTMCATTDATYKTVFDRSTLETKREISPFKRIDGASSFSVGILSTAHGKVSRYDGCTYNYVCEQGFQTWNHIVRTNADLSYTSIGKVPLNEGKISYVHDVSVTDRYAILCLYPAFVDMADAVKVGSVFPVVKFDPKSKTQIHLFDLQQEEPVLSYEAPPMFAYHHVNAFEDESTNSVVLDLVAYPDASLLNSPHGFLYMDNMKTHEYRLKQAQDGNVWRMVMDLDRPNTWVTPDKRLVMDEKTKRPWSMELPTVSPQVLGKPYRYVYAHTGFYRGENHGFLDWPIVKQDVEKNVRNKLWFEEYSYPGEPIFVPDPEGKEEDDGVLLSTVYDARRKENFLLVLNASNMQELARAYTGVGFPSSFHGKFFPSER